MASRREIGVGGRPYFSVGDFDRPSKGVLYEKGVDSVAEMLSGGIKHWVVAPLKQ